jgi:hypothetical protein
MDHFRIPYEVDALAAPEIPHTPQERLNMVPSRLRKLHIKFTRPDVVVVKASRFKMRLFIA